MATESKKEVIIVKAAIWGTGHIANLHAEALAANGITLAAVVNHRLDKAKEFADTWKVPAYSQDPSILFDPSIDCVHVCTPPGLHYAMLLQLFKHHKHMICEKPLCITNKEADTLNSLWLESGLVCAVNFNVRYHPACQEMKKKVAQGDLGILRLVHGTYLQEFHALPAPDGWRYDPSLGGPLRAVTEIGTHWLDLAQHVTGKSITAVAALLQQHHPERHVSEGWHYPAQEGIEKPYKRAKVASEDTALIHLRFQDDL